MKNLLFAAAIGAALSVCGFSLAGHGDHGKESVKVLSERDIAESLNGKPAKVTTVEVTFGPGIAGKPHRHPGPVFGYVLEGELELGLGDEPARTLKAGETFYEPGGILHRVSRNPSNKNTARILAVVLHPRDGAPLVSPASSD